MRANTDKVTIHVELQRVISLKAQMEPRIGPPRDLKGEIVGFAQSEPLTASIARN
jgi:hypothetical protein